MSFINYAAKKVAKHLERRLLASLGNVFRNELEPIHHALKEIHMDLQQATDALTSASTTLDKIATESAANVAAVADLTAQVAALKANGVLIDPTLEALINKVVAQTQAVDNLVPDAPGADGTPAS